MTIKKLTIYRQLKIYTFHIQNSGIGWLRNFNATLIPIFQDEHQS